MRMHACVCMLADGWTVEWACTRARMQVLARAGMCFGACACVNPCVCAHVSMLALYLVRSPAQ